MTRQLPKVIIISQPKSGTYLLSEVVKRIGFVQTYMHINDRYYHQYDPDHIDQGKVNPNKYRKSVKMEQSARLVDPGSFAVTHQTFNERTKNIFGDFFKIVITRNKSERQESWDNFFNGKIRHRQGFKDVSVAGWENEDFTFFIDFSDIIDKNIQKIDQLQVFLLGSVQQDSLKIIEESLAAETLTKSSKR
jgi:hypothetical protein